MEKLKVVQLPSHYVPTHDTAGLPGFPAIDTFGPSGSPVASPIAGTVIKLSGHPPVKTLPPGKRHGAFGYSIYLARVVIAPGVFEDVYFLTHFGQKAVNYWKVGAKVRRGQYLGKIGYFAEATDGETPSHIHEGFHAGRWTL